LAARIHRDRAEQVWRAAGPWLESAPSAVTHLAAVLLAARGTQRQLAVVGPAADPATRALLAAAEGEYRPGLVVARGDGVHDGGVPLLAGRGLLAGRPAAYLCDDLACAAPTADPAELSRLLSGQLRVADPGA